MSQRFQTAIRAARAAGKVLAEKSDDAREIKYKGRRDIVTDADYAADRTIREILLAQFPDDKFLSEEGDAVERKRLWAQADASDKLTLWVVDPLDGQLFAQPLSVHDIDCVVSSWDGASRSGL